MQGVSFKPPKPSCNHYKEKCIFCEEKNQKMNKEHIFPQWLLKMTSNTKEPLNWIYGTVSADKLVVPLCVECNSLLSVEIETPMSNVLKRIENGQGFNDAEAELIIRWLWKMKGMFYWSHCYDGWEYSSFRMKDHILGEITKPRSRISIGVSLASKNEKGYIPIGLCDMTLYSNMFVSGVFSRTSFIVFYTDLIKYIDQEIWTVHTLSDVPNILNDKKKFYPKTSFSTGVEACYDTRIKAGKNSTLFKEHEKKAIKARLKLEELNKTVIPPS